MYVIENPSAELGGAYVPVGMSIRTDVSPGDSIPLDQVISKWSMSTPGTVKPREVEFQTLSAEYPVPSSKGTSLTMNQHPG